MLSCACIEEKKMKKGTLGENWKSCCCRAVYRLRPSFFPWEAAAASFFTGKRRQITNWLPKKPNNKMGGNMLISCVMYIWAQPLIMTLWWTKIGVGFALPLKWLECNLQIFAHFAQLTILWGASNCTRGSSYVEFIFLRGQEISSETETE